MTVLEEEKKSQSSEIAPLFSAISLARLPPFLSQSKARRLPRCCVKKEGKKLSPVRQRQHPLPRDHERRRRQMAPPRRRDELLELRRRTGSRGEEGELAQEGGGASGCVFSIGSRGRRAGRGDRGQRRGRHRRDGERERANESAPREEKK